jgi:stage V sporulation protein S
MDRFFSKLDLRDIKIDPEAKFPPDDEPYELEEAEQAEPNGIERDTPTNRVTRPEQRNGEVLKVSARSRPSAVAGAIAGVVRESGRAEVQAIGAGATNQAVKAVAIARDYLQETGIEAICLPAFIDVVIDDEDRTAIRLVVEPR